jgi:hypothetical protein
MTLKTFNALDKAIAPPAEAGTPNPVRSSHRVLLYGVPALAGEVEIWPGMKELKGMLK